MYGYVYDAFLRERKYDTILAKIEGRLLELGIQGRSEKLTILKSIKDLAEACIRRGADTLVVVGDDQTVSKIISIIADHDVILGIIPMGEHNRVAQYLGIPSGLAACDVLSTRIVERVDLGKANDTYFLSFLDVAAGSELFVDCGDFTVETGKQPQTLSVYNFGGQGHSPRDGKLEAVMRPVQQGEAKKGGLFRKAHEVDETIISLTKARIKSFAGSLPAHADGQTVVKTPIALSVEPKKMRVIVGKNRQFV